MITEIGSRLRITNPSPDMVDWCKKHLEIPNPEYQKKARMNLWLGDTPRTLVMYEVDGDSVIIPFGCLRSILPLLEGDVKKLFTKQVKVDYKGAKVPLYDYQEEAVGAMIINHYGILQSPAGSGKTQIGIALACSMRLKTLWLTHTKDLLTQSKNRAAQYIDKSLLGTITEGKVNIGETMTFATIQTMCKVDLNQYFESPEAMRGIFTWLVAGYFKYRRFGLKMSANMQKVVKQYEKDNDLVLQYLEEKCQKQDDVKTRAKTLYDNYKLWCKSNGYYVCSMKKFNAELMAHPEWYEQKSVSGGVAVYYGIMMKTTG